MAVPSCFISHSQRRDGALARQLGVELGRRGIRPWIDVHELAVGVGLLDALKGAIRQQTAVCCLVSEASMASEWVSRELTHALTLSMSDPSLRDWILPVFLGDPARLAAMHPGLAEYMAQDGIPLNRLALVPRSASASDIADALADALYPRLGFLGAPEVSIVVDQRGAGRRAGLPEILGGLPERPTLLFRPDQGERSFHEVVRGGDWDALAATYTRSLRMALGTLRAGQEIHLYGDRQLAWAWLTGGCFDRATHVRLTATHGRTGHVLSFDMGGMTAPLSGGNRWCHDAHERRVPELPRGEALDRVSLLLFKREGGERPLTEALRYIDAAGGAPPVLVRHPEQIHDASEVVELARDVTALLLRLGDEHRVRAVDLFTTLPFHALPLFAALMRNVVDRWVAFELDRAATGDASRYVPLPIPL